MVWQWIRNVLFFGSALAVGVYLALPEAGSGHSGPVQMISRVLSPAVAAPDAGAPAQATQAAAQPSAASIPRVSGRESVRAAAPAVAEVPAVQLASGVQLVLEEGPERADVRFGYRVVGQSIDPRFREGDLITAVGGFPVEASAAGSELLLAALSNPETPVRVVGD